MFEIVMGIDDLRIQLVKYCVQRGSWVVGRGERKWRRVNKMSTKRVFLC